MSDTSLTFGDRAAKRWDENPAPTLRRAKPIKPCITCGLPTPGFEERRGTDVHFYFECPNGHIAERFGGGNELTATEALQNGYVEVAP